MSKSIGRNDPCPCGSGKKYKKCCFGLSEPLPDPDQGTDGISIDQESETMERMWAEHPEYADFLDSEQRVTGDGVNPSLHVAFHTIVENQLAANDPPETAEALKRLMDAGWDRHDAVHAIGQHVATMVWTTMKKKKPADVEAYKRELRRLG